ncbi:hypothetical protein [Actinomadura decatromicini]|uniref:Helix-turn-helix domain-containing protein n=1 Tax=Actinomadura decatromicini TaxID=2604572 RepID=A0A5D3F8M9_9ACTN|nr:hypothetical protein [Actinomadura decatromicini]TYK44563.1 hypothetical protein FXF68_34455 [Actinomadura decatromicini]
MDLLLPYTNRTDILVDLEYSIRNLEKSLATPVEVSSSVRRQTNSAAGASRQRVTVRLTEAEISALVAEFQDGTAAWKLAKRYEIGLSTVKRILRDRKARPSDALRRDSDPNSGRGRRMSRMVAEIVRAREDGRLPERFRAADVREACPGWAENTYSTVLSDHRVGNPGDDTAYFVRHADGTYSLF